MSFVERQHCPGCEASEFKTIWRTAFDAPPLRDYLTKYYGREPPSGDFWLVQCAECSLFFQKLIGDDAFLGAVYGEWIDDTNNPMEQASYRADMADIRGSRDAHEITTFASYLRKGTEDLTVLDYGAGWGFWSRAALTLGATVFAVELAPKRADNLRRMGVKVISDDDLPKHHFDVASLEQSLEHVVDPLDLVRRLRGATIIKVGVPDAAPITADGLAKLKHIHAVQPFEHINGFTAPALDALANKVGRRRVRPGLRNSYAFLRQAAFPKDGKRAIKELVRPLYRPPIYAWLK